MPPKVSLRTQQLVERVFELDQVTEAARWLEYDQTLAWLVEDGATTSEALIALLAG